MKATITILLVAITAAAVSCSPYDPREDPALPRVDESSAKPGAPRATFLGNTTLHVSDGTTDLMIDGFLSRPGKIRTLFGRISSKPGIVASELEASGIRKLDAIFVGHAHHDHALDAPEVARRTGAVVAGSRSYRFIHEGAGGALDRRHLITLKKDREIHRFGKFTVTFVRSEHVGSHSRAQALVEGTIDRPVIPPARFSDFKCGDVYAIHIAHPRGNIAVTTSAGARAGQFKGLKADVVFLGIALIEKETAAKQDLYWQETIGTLDPVTVVPIHWDDFSRPLSVGLRPMPRFMSDIGKAMARAKAKDTSARIRIMDLRDTIVIPLERAR